MGIGKVWESDNEEYRAESAARLKKLFPIGSTVTTQVLHVSQSGMMRIVQVLAYDKARNEVINVSMTVARVLNRSYDFDRGGVRMDGCGMDMCFALVYDPSHTLYRGSRSKKIESPARAGYALKNRSL